MFDQRLGTNHDQYYLAEAGSATVKVILKEELFINRLKIYPIKRFYTKIKVRKTWIRYCYFLIIRYYTVLIMKLIINTPFLFSKNVIFIQKKNV